MKKHNFYAGPSILSPYTIKGTADAVLDFAGTGLSILEVSHRSKEFQAVVDEAVALFKELLEIPEGYHVLFLGVEACPSEGRPKPVMEPLMVSPCSGVRALTFTIPEQWM